MPTSDAYNKADRHYQIIKLFSLPGQRLRTIQIAEKFGVSEDTIKKDIDELSFSGRLPLRKDGHFWILAEDARLEVLQVRLNLTEATALYLAGRLLSQMHDERNEHIIMALTKLVDAMPKTLAHHQHALVDMARQRQQGREDRSNIFNAIALGWSRHRKVRLLYAPPRKRKFECLFSPYLLEPSAIGRTFYAIGHSTLPNDLRSYKLERIEFAELTDESFEVPETFDGPALLARAWGIMYGDEEPVEVRLRFSHWVTKRVKETLWHPSQQIKDTEDGCEMTLQIGDTLEIENWIRGWGPDCEVLSPVELREKMIDDVRRSARLYGLAFRQPTSAGELDEDLFNSFFGE
jgi:predicted DNA-binding transcriptional regulator YafY